MSVAVAGKTFYELVGDFWNHTPRMIDEVSRRGYAWPSLDPQEMADALSYLYYVRLFDEPGNAVRGADTFARLQCDGCHTLGGRGGTVGGPHDRFGTYPSPAPLAQAMWNAGPRMQQEQLRRGSPIPQFTGHEMQVFDPLAAAASGGAEVDIDRPDRRLLLGNERSRADDHGESKECASSDHRPSTSERPPPPAWSMPALSA